MTERSEGIVSSDGFGLWVSALDNMSHEQLTSVLTFVIGKLGERAPAKALMEDQSWPLRDVLAKLIEASEILMHQKNYDGHGWEQISHAIERGKVALLAWPNQ